MKTFWTSLICWIILTNIYAQNFEVYISDAGNFNKPPWQIIKTDFKGENAEVFIKDSLNWPQDILFLEKENTVLISNLGSGKITIHNSSTGEYLGVFANNIGGPTRMKIGPDGLLYVLQWAGNYKIKRYSLSGDFIDDFTNIGIEKSIGIDWDKNGNVFVSSYNLDLVKMFDPEGKFVKNFIDSNLVGPTNIWFDKSGNLLVSDYDGTAVKQFDSTGKFLGEIFKNLNHSEGFDYLPNGDILIGNGSSNSVKRFSPEGKFLGDFIQPKTSNLLNPNAIRVRKI